jgi:hypothetical protein
MDYSPENASVLLSLIENSLQQDEGPSVKINRIWARILNLRMRALTNGLRQIIGETVFGGPFKGMKLTEKALNQYHSAALLGCYEHELHHIVESIIAKNYPHVLNIGCSVGYYAVGLALRMPQLNVDAHDFSPEARAACDEMARINQVGERVRVSGQFYGDDFARYENQRTLLLMDIEGGEAELLNPDRYPALKKMDIVVELHDLVVPGISKAVCERFAPTHSIELIRNQNFLPDLTRVLSPTSDLDPFDHLLMGWDGRNGPTPWGIFRVREL